VSLGACDAADRIMAVLASLLGQEVVWLTSYDRANIATIRVCEGGRFVALLGPVF
jgi:hypothetical protein